MAVAAQDTLLPENLAAQRTEALHAGGSSQIFTASAETFLLNTGRLPDHNLVSATGSLVVDEVFRSANSHPFQHDQGAEMTGRHADGMYTWLKWIASHERTKQQFQAARPEKRLEYAVTMARRDVFAQRTHQIFSYLDMHFNLSGREFDEAGFIITRNELETLVSDMAQEWGFSDFDELYEFGNQFKQALGSSPFEQISKQIETENPNSCKGNHAKQAWFSFFYVNMLYPPNTYDAQGREVRQVALHRLGLPGDTQYLQIYRPDREFVDGRRVGRFLTNWNESYVRTSEQQLTLHKSVVAVA